MNDTITITGNVATEPQHKRTAAGVPITTFRIASGQRRYDRSAEAWVDSVTNFYSVSAFRGLAEHAFQSLRKGERVILSGRLRVRDWDNGTKNWNLPPQIQPRITATAVGTVDPNQCDAGRPSTGHTGGSLAGMGDGSVRVVGASVSQTTWQAALLPDDGVPLGSDW